MATQLHSIDISPHLKIPQEIKNDPHCQYEIHYYWKMMESNVVFPVESGVLSKQSLMTNHHLIILSLTGWLEFKYRFYTDLEGLKSFNPGVESI